MKFFLSLGCHRFQLWIEDIIITWRIGGRRRPGTARARSGPGPSRSLDRTRSFGTSRWEVRRRRPRLWRFDRPRGRILSGSGRGRFPPSPPSCFPLFHDSAELLHLAAGHFLLVSGQDRTSGKRGFESGSEDSVVCVRDRVRGRECSRWNPFSIDAWKWLEWLKYVE